MRSLGLRCLHVHLVFLPALGKSKQERAHSHGAARRSFHPHPFNHKSQLVLVRRGVSMQHIMQRIGRPSLQRTVSFGLIGSTEMKFSSWWLCRRGCTLTAASAAKPELCQGQENLLQNRMELESSKNWNKDE